ncbi:MULTISPECIES: haloacid dehalogenase type II [Pseudomonas]|uniref:(S)-2-haloacid dehalogenase n=1 Tax=Pseudomonas frederiksbergensis TaxID=104087 RepID=A0A6L5C2J0_9PSED|nr:MULTISPECIES: haloacid dehalogenase type II [Pseudomonas]KAA8554044.1 (S)-2-haloacid dehalogenase 4A [Pseudomonas marginalis]KAF2394810.1 (S)-2-haloacid dehalogenase 4A [Pseudomonas frederiksbergensis]
MTLPQALAFDVFGTVVDWHSSIARETSTFLSEYLPSVSPADFALQWRELYLPAMRECVSGQRGFVVLDTLHYETLQKLLGAHGLDVSQIASDVLWKLAHAWRRLDPWPDVAEGLAQLRRRFPIVTLSNANVELMIAMNRYNGLQWDALLGAEFAQTYKPDPVAYLTTAQALGLEPQQLCLVACHHSDLAAARACGLMTAYIDRPMEYGGAPAPDAGDVQSWDWQANSFTDLGHKLQD